MNEINPTFIRIRSLAIPGNIPLREKCENGEFERLNDEEIIAELRLFISSLEGIDSTIVSDHVLNLLEELNGKLPEDKDDMLAVIDEFLNLEQDDRLLYILGRRAGILRAVSDLNNPNVRLQVEGILNRIKSSTEGDVQEVVNNLLEQYI